jgi:hypothetical protein
LEHCSQEIDGPIRGRSGDPACGCVGLRCLRGLFKSNVPRDEEIDAAFGNPQGYSYEEWPPEAKDIAEKAIADNPEMADLEVRFDGRMVMRDGVPLGTVVIIGMDPAELEGLDEEMLPTGVQMGPGASLAKVSRGGTEMFEMKLPQGGVAMFLDPKTDS